MATASSRNFAAKQASPAIGSTTELAAMWYVRDANWKLNQAGELFDMSDAPFTEKPVPPGADNQPATAARIRLGAVLAKLNPAGGIPDSGDGTAVMPTRRKNRSLRRHGVPNLDVVEESALSGHADFNLRLRLVANP